MVTIAPRAVFVIRETDYELLVARHATRGQANFFLQRRAQNITAIERKHRQFHDALKTARASVPGDWRQTLVNRFDLDRFLFEPEDVVIAFGQDGLVANIAKYLNGQPVLGVNPAPDVHDGVLVRIRLAHLPKLLRLNLAKETIIERRTMVEATLETGETLLALNEVFIGHRSHQSARYRIEIQGQDEEQSSSGLIVASGTGATGWARSIIEATRANIHLDIDETAVAFFVREPFPSISTGTKVREGKLSNNTLNVTSHMNEGGVIFADGIEHDFIAFNWGRTVRLGPSRKKLNLIVG